jgi:RND family efflux transporter MFP subunit
MKFFPLPLLALALAAGCARHEPAAASPGLPSARVRVTAAVGAEVPNYTEATGTVRPVRRAVLAARTSGAITELPVNLGQRVRADEVLVRLFAADVQARLTHAKAQLNVARRDLERETGLLAKGASTAETVRNLQDRVTGSEALVREAEVQVADTELRAPFDGVIARKLVNGGDLASPGQPLLEVEGINDLEVEAAIPDSAAAALNPGTGFICEAGSVTFTGTLREVSSSADAATRTIGVKLAVPAGTAVRSGQFTRVQVPGTTRRTVLVPAAALSPQGQMERVFVVGAGNRAVLRIVKSGARRGDAVEMLAGLADGERVVLAPPPGLRDGQPLEVQP